MPTTKEAVAGVEGLASASASPANSMTSLQGEAAKGAVDPQREISASAAPSAGTGGNGETPRELSEDELWTIEREALRARELALEKAYYDRAQPFSPLGFSVSYRNPGHWDVMAKQCPGKVSAWLEAETGRITSAHDGEQERAFRIRGASGDVRVFDERWNPHRPHPRPDLKFRDIQTAMLWICGELMLEPSHD